MSGPNPGTVESNRQRHVIFVPFPHAADNHQEFNARLLVEKGAGDMLLESELSGVVLWDKICHYRSHPDELSRMASRARSMTTPTWSPKSTGAATPALFSRMASTKCSGNCVYW